MIPTTAQIYIGLDLGQRRDHTAIAVLEREEFRIAWMPNVPRYMRVRHLERVPLGTPYTAVVERIREIAGHPLLENRCRLVADATGVGAPVVDLLKAARLPCPLTSVIITSGDKAHGSGDHWHVPKSDLLASVLVLLESRQLKIPVSLKEAGTLIHELTEVQIRHRPAGPPRLGADAPGQHDDLVIALALACWRAKSKPIGYGSQRLPGI